MPSITPPASLLGGGEWLIAGTDPATLCTPERLTSEQRMVARTVSDFVKQEVLPALDDLEKKDWVLARRLVKRCGDLGLLGADIAQADGGLQLDKTTSILISESMVPCASFATTFGAHANLVIPALSLFGTEGQKRRYLPRLMAGEMIGAYCLSEAGSGSDALGAATRAARQPDGSFVLSGEKMWVSNGGFADLFVVFAKVGGEQFTAFLVEREAPGIASGREEHKMGLHGSSTTSVLLQNVRVPIENVLGEIGRGSRIAFNVLNFARLKLGAICAGGAQSAIGEAARYSATRRQFGQPIATFGAIRHKLGQMCVRAYGVESLIYRTVGLIDARIAAAPHDVANQSATLTTFEEYAVEASIAKVAGSEMLDFVLDENVQIHGGNGYVRDYPAERHYRDARVNRIFEGTNEINRLLVPGILARRASKGDLPLIAAARALQDEVPDPPPGASRDGSPLAPLAEERRSVDAFKKIALMSLGLAMETHREALVEQQEVLMHLADILINTYAADSAVLRAAAVGDAREASLHADAARVFVSDAGMRIDASARQALAALTEDAALVSAIATLRRLSPETAVNTVPLRRRIADQAVASGSYVFRAG